MFRTKAMLGALTGAFTQPHSFMPEGVALRGAQKASALEALRHVMRRAELGLGPFGEMEMAGAPAFSDLKTFAVMRPDAVEAVRQPLYDTILYPTAGQTQLRFFQTPQGQGSSAQQGAANTPKTLADTNMELAGQLPNPKAFLCTSIEVIFDPGSVSTANTYTPIAPASGTVGIVTGQNDIWNVLTGGWLDFFLISKSYLQNARLDSFPPKSHVAFDGAIATTVAASTPTLGVSGRSIGRPFYVNPPVLILPNTAFNLTANWPVAVATPSGFNGRILVRLDGFTYRNAQ